MAVSKLQPFDSSCKTPGISGIRVGPRLHLRLCAELLDLAHLHEKFNAIYLAVDFFQYAKVWARIKRLFQ
jgi:hypothetical protein